MIELHGRWPLGTDVLAIAGIDHHRVGIDAGGFQQGAHECGLVFAVAVILGEDMLRRVGSIAATVRDIHID